MLAVFVVARFNTPLETIIAPALAIVFAEFDRAVTVIGPRIVAVPVPAQVRVTVFPAPPTVVALIALTFKFESAKLFRLLLMVLAEELWFANATMKSDMLPLNVGLP
jgi:hypothetical protein